MLTGFTWIGSCEHASQAGRRTGAAAFSGRSLLPGAALLAAGTALEVFGTSAAAIGTQPVPRSPYLSGDYGPVKREVTVTDLTATGRLPEPLPGDFIRNGPKPSSSVFATDLGGPPDHRRR
jgi:hypothetical protein